MIFDTPQWKWRVAESIVTYGHVKGVVNVYPERGKIRRSPVVIPTEFFQFTEAILSDDQKAQAAGLGIQFYCDDLGGGRWVFGFCFGQETYDLWLYTKSTMPVWFDLAKPV